MPDEVIEPQQDSPTTTRYGFGGALADAWELFRAHLRDICLIFAGSHVVAALVSFLVILAASMLGSSAAIPARMTAGVVIPVVAGSLAVALLSSALGREDAEEQPSIRQAIAGLDRGEVVGMSLVAALMAVIAVVFLGGYGVLVLAFFYGPPIAMQVVVAERRSISESIQTARVLLTGRWHTMLYLFAVALILGLVSIVPVGGLVSLAGDRSDVPTIGVLSLGRGLLIGLFAGFLGAMQISIYRRLQERPAQVTGVAATPD